MMNHYIMNMKGDGKVTNLESIINDGFYIFEQRSNMKNVALLSLRVALKSFFSTYQSNKYYLREVDVEGNSTQYCELCSVTIVHFQHFFELIIKDFLYNENPLLAMNATNKPVIFDKLLKGEAISEEDKEGLKSIEFSEALARLNALINEGRITDRTVEFIASSQQVLNKLNNLRNRIWHRGAYILRYPALDKLVGILLPIVKQVLARPDYSDIWKYYKLNCNIDPFEEIINEFQSGSYNLKKIAMLKELGRAAYKNPVGFGQGLYEETILRLERRASVENKMPNVSDIRTCPVCGCKTLIVYKEIDEKGYNPQDESYEEVWEYTYEVNCICCSFNIEHNLDNPRAYTFDIDDFWSTHKLG